jgi:hypothetical protein
MIYQMITKSLSRLTLVMLALFCTLSIRAAEPAAPVEWMEWAKWAEKLYPITDSQGHGPDIGSDEWAGAMDRRLKITDEAGHGPTVKSKEWRQAVEKKIVKPEKPKPEKKNEMLSSHGNKVGYGSMNLYLALQD